VAGAGRGPAEVKKYVEEYQDTEKLDFLRRDTALGNRGPRQSDRGTRVATCTAMTASKQAAVDIGRWEGGSEPAALPPPPCERGAPPSGPAVKQLVRNFMRLWALGLPTHHTPHTTHTRTRGGGCLYLCRSRQEPRTLNPEGRRAEVVMGTGAGGGGWALGAGRWALGAWA
jgi:hypothetical protein